ncbi:mitogen-activated protein kinase 4-like [Ptychodera flava]|uniref:mitogen-activated protein kinase 4-like n=1 Tax=Ptychodera flava TaxID=63121 RepID=UPI00396A2DE1
MGDDDMLSSPLQYSFTVGPRYTDLKPLGFGGNGLVCSAVDSECDKHVAVKKISFSDRKSCKQALREIKIIRRLRHENIVHVCEILSAHGDNIDLNTTDNINEFRTVYLIQELLDTDLHRVIQSQTLSGGYIRLFMYQLLRGLKYIHSANVLHRDLKPSNLLINMEDLTLRIGDFGLARIVDPMYCHKGYLSENVSTRWYRSPELMLTPNNYTKAIDVWSCGCILAELLLGKPIFPGANEAEQISLILDAVPVPVDRIDEILDLVPKNLLKNYQGQPKHPLRERFPNIERDALNLLECLLTFDSRDRITAEEALQHPFMHVYSYPPDEPITDQPFYIESEVDDLSPTTLKKILISESSNVQWHNNVDVDNEALALSDLTLKDRILDNSGSEISEEDLMNRSFTELENHSVVDMVEGQEKLPLPNNLAEKFNGKIEEEEEEENMAFERKLALDYESECSEKSDNDAKEDVTPCENKTEDMLEELELEEKLQMEVAENEKISQDGENVVDKKDKCKLNVACFVKMKDKNEVEEEAELMKTEKGDGGEERKVNEDVEKMLKVNLKKDDEKASKESSEKPSSEFNRNTKTKKEMDVVKRKVKTNCSHRNSKEEYHDREKSLQHCLEIEHFRALPDDRGDGEKHQGMDQNLSDTKKKLSCRHKTCENHKHDCVNAEGYTSPKLQHKMNEIRKMELERNKAVRLSLIGRQKGLEEYKQQLHIDLPVRDMECTSGPNSPRSPKTYSPRGEKSVRPKKYKPKGKQ